MVVNVVVAPVRSYSDWPVSYSAVPEIQKDLRVFIYASDQVAIKNIITMEGRQWPG